jgi:uncharacterized protein (DUF2237 family)
MKSVILFLPFLLRSLPLVAADGTTSTSTKLNVYGDMLQPCSTDNMALTGWTRTGYCEDKIDDAGSHHICIDISSTMGGNFCEVTGQSDWCSKEMPCHNNSIKKVCPVENWCVCQWAFASYLKKAGGCDKIQNVVCESINMEAVLAYKSTPGNDAALECLIERCDLVLAE